MSGRDIATKALIAAYKTATPGSAKQLACIAALGRVGGEQAAKGLASMLDTATPGSKKQLAVIQALGEVGRVP
jgi:hypothetical protein